MLEIPEVSDLTALREIRRRESVFDAHLTAAARRQWLSGSARCHLLLQQFIKLYAINRAINLSELSEFIRTFYQNNLINIYLNKKFFKRIFFFRSL